MAKSWHPHVSRKCSTKDKCKNANKITMAIFNVGKVHASLQNALQKTERHLILEIECRSKVLYLEVS